jgi:hypothetical protein
VNRGCGNDAQRPRCGALKKARSAAAQASLTNALLGVTGNHLDRPDPTSPYNNTDSANYHRKPEIAPEYDEHVADWPSAGRFMDECAYQKLSRGIDKREACDQSPMSARWSHCHKGCANNRHPKHSKEKSTHTGDK